MTNEKRPRIEVGKAPQIRQLISKKWICGKCGLFCMELVPVMKRGMTAQHLKVHKIYCRNDCHLREDWKPREFQNIHRI